jgi:hypothetical protein
MTRNLTPDSNGLREGLTKKEFVTVMRTGEEDLVTGLHRGSHLAALDQIGVGFEYRIELIGVGDLLSPGGHDGALDR